VILAALALAAPAHATFPGANGKIAFIQAAGHQGSEHNVWTMNADGTGQTQLTTSDHAGAPAWSPDGQKIALARYVDGNTDIWVMNADGSNMTRLTTDPEFDFDPAWSPDGRIVFVTLRDHNPYQFGSCQVPCNYELYAMNADGSNQTRVTYTPDIDEGAPDWSPDGTRIAFEGSTWDTGQEVARIYTINPDGSDQRALITGGLPSWSPEGNRIAFTNGQVWTMNADGSGLVQVTHLSSGFARDAVWSPNAGQIAAYRCSSGCPPYQVFVVNSNGGSIETNVATGTQPAWQRISQPDYGYVRPKGASPFQSFFTPAFRSCSAPNGAHGAPLAFPSCAPPQPTSDYVTVGTPDSNGAGTNFIGESRLVTVPGDVKVTVTLSDIRCTDSASACTGGALSDYTGPMRLALPMRLTDSYVKGLAATSEGTASVPIPCSPTAATNVGSSCAVDTTINSVLPGAVRAGSRAIWELHQLQVWDSGQDGLLSTRDDDTLFATEGILIP
jgi:hypothetical protein